MQQQQWWEVRRALREANLEERVAVKTEAIQRIKLLRETKSNLRRMDREKAYLRRVCSMKKLTSASLNY
jgi:ribosomal protein L19